MATEVVSHTITYDDGSQVELGISGGAHAIHRGLELEYVSTTQVRVLAGSLTHGKHTNIEQTSNTTLILSTAADWYDGSTHSYSGGAGWCYVGVDSSGNVKLLANNPPDKADDSGNTDGTKLYWYDSGNTKYWRVIGAFRINTSDNVDLKFYQIGDWVFYDRKQEVVADDTPPTSFTDVDCSGVVPAFSRHIKIQIRLRGSGLTPQLTFRTNGGVGAYAELVDQDAAASFSNQFGFIDLNLDSSQIYEYQCDRSTVTTNNHEVLGFCVGNIR